MVKLIFSLFFTYLLVFVLNTPFGNFPSIAKILNPFEGIWQNAEPIDNILKGKTIKIKGKRDTVNIFFDENLIPHIKATNDIDLYYAQGYVIAMFRLWQTDTLSRVAQGTLSEVFGRKTLNSDRLMRRNNFPTLLKNMITAVKKEDDNFFQCMEAYRDGLNDFVSGLKYKNLPIEYKLLNYFPKKFTLEDLASCGALVMYDMSSTNNSINATLDYYSLGEDLYNRIHKDRFSEKFPVIRKTFKSKDSLSRLKNFKKKNNFEGIVQKKDLDIIFPIINSSEIDKERSNSIEPKDSSPMGSNCWAISSIKSKNKKATILASDPHLNLTSPSLFFVNCLETPRNRSFGFSIPGVPDVLFGKNLNIAWGVTNGSICVSSFYKIKFKNESCEEYLVNEKWEETNFKEEFIKIKNKETFIDKVMHTSFGPVIYDESFKHSSGLYNIAIKYNVHNFVNELLAIHKINRSQNYEEFKNAIASFGSPILNMTFISKNGDIAINVIGNFPVLKTKHNDLIFDGQNLENLWSENIQLHNILEEVNPKRGYVSSANQKISDNSFCFTYKPYAMQYYRGERINYLLESKNNFSINDVMTMQNDCYNLAAEQSLDLIRKFVKEESLNDEYKVILKILLSWDLQNTYNQVGPSIFRQWQFEVLKIMWRELYPIKSEMSFFSTIEILKNNELDLKIYKNLENLIKISFERASEKILNWEKKYKKKAYWHDYRNFKVNHGLGIASFGRQKSKVSGGKDIISCNEGNVGASYKMITVFENEGSKTYFSYPGGQSGNPGSFYYDNFFEQWEEGKYIKVEL